MTHFDRRKFLKSSLIAGTGLVLVPNFISCSNDDDFSSQIDTSGFANQNFNQGVASFDPTRNGVIIWTRYSGGAGQVSIRYQVATDVDFTEIVRSRVVETDASRDYTVSVELRDLQSNQQLYYRFLNEEEETISPIGQTITLPEDASAVSMAVVSCSNIASGFFNVYNDIASSDVDIVIHLGDYIYEYGQGEYGTTPLTAQQGRTPVPSNEIVSIDDYRVRYRQYREDEDLKLLHQSKPFIAVWDDHEITNDAWTDGAENHDASEGSYSLRKQVAIQVYSEYMPLMTSDNSRIYRSFDLNANNKLIMLDTRVIGRNKQLNYADYFDAMGNFDVVSFQQQLLDPTRTLLGATQRDWLLGQLSLNPGNNIVGQQVLMARMNVPAELLTALVTITGELSAAGSVSPATLMAFQQQLQELVIIKTRILQGDPTVTPQERARVETQLPYNLDAWDGYPLERELVLNAMTGTTVVLAGDTHNAWSSNITSATGSEVATEVATSSVSSPGFEGFLGSNPVTVAGFQQAIQLLIDDLSYFDASRRGWMKVTAGGDVAVEWNFIDNLETRNYNSVSENAITIS